jgi:hypothetical protein
MTKATRKLSQPAGRRALEVTPRASVKKAAAESLDATKEPVPGTKLSVQQTAVFMMMERLFETMRNPNASQTSRDAAAYGLLALFRRCVPADVRL